MTQRDWLTSPSPRDVFGPDPEGERPWWADASESSFEEYPGEQTRPELELEPFICRCCCGCTNVATNGLFCENCEPSEAVTWR
jgi:hypothetical protein